MWVNIEVNMNCQSQHFFSTICSKEDVSRVLIWVTTWSNCLKIVEKTKWSQFWFYVEIILSRISDYMDLTPVDIVGKRCYHFIHAEDVEGIRQSHLDCEYLLRNPSNQSVQPPNSAKNYRMVVKEQDSVSLHALAGLIDHWSMTSWEHTVLRAKAGVMCSLQHFSVMGQQCDRQDYPC